MSNGFNNLLIERVLGRDLVETEGDTKISSLALDGVVGPRADGEVGADGVDVETEVLRRGVNGR